MNRLRICVDGVETGKTHGGPRLLLARTEWEGMGLDHAMLGREKGREGGMNGLNNQERKEGKKRRGDSRIGSLT